MSPDVRAAIEAAVVAALGPGHAVERAAPASGGCIHDSFVVQSGPVRLFVKTNGAALAAAFAAEADGLAALIAAGMRAPRPLGHGVAASHAYLAMEYLDLAGGGDWATMGRVLAAMHRATGRQTGGQTGQRFGWRRDNFIGATPQSNCAHDDWPGFWRDARLLPQLALAARNGLGSQLIDAGERLAAMLPRLLAGHSPQASLLHGDLWSGNAAFLPGGSPVLFDPAIYFGDREADLAMTELFGGFPPSFYAAYAEAWPLNAGYALRRDLYNLYHVLNHANLFGGGYAAQAQALIGRLLCETR
jgi:protein-ribulosamine 3-kinase